MPDWTGYAIDMGCYRQYQIKGKMFQKLFPESFKYIVNIYLDGEFYSSYKFENNELAKVFLKTYFQFLYK